LVLFERGITNLHLILSLLGLARGKLGVSWTCEFLCEWSL